MFNVVSGLLFIGPVHEDSQIEDSQEELTESQSKARMLQLDAEQYEDEMYDDSQLIWVGSVPEGKTVQEMEVEINDARDKETRDSWQLVPINIEDSLKRPTRVIQPPEKYTPTQVPRPFMKLVKGVDRVQKIPLSPPLDPTSLADVLIMETWLKIGVRKSKDEEGRWYSKKEDKMPWRWNFTELEVRSKSFFYTMWTPEEWLSDQVNPFSISLSV